MTQPIVDQLLPLAETRKPIKLSHQNGVSENSIENKIISISGQRKKKEVIEIDDSEEPQQPQKKNKEESRVKAVLSEKNSNLKKIKKISNKCQLCKETGKKKSMKLCVDCRAFFHIKCLEQEGEATNRYRCRKCRYKKQQLLIKTYQNKKQDQKSIIPAEQEKLAQKKQEKEKKKEEHGKRFKEFAERYPYYLQEDKIRYPVEDKLLFIYRQIFQVNENSKISPSEHPLIAPALLGDLLQIDNFFSTFQEELDEYAVVMKNVSKEQVWISLNEDGYDQIFCCYLHCLLKIYLSDIFDKNKTDNVKILNEHSFFTLLTYLNQNSDLTGIFIVKAAEEVIRYLTSIPSMKKSFENLHFPNHLTYQHKIHLILALIKGMSEVDQFHELVSIKSEKMQQYTKEKTELIAQLKVDQAENLSNNQKLKDMANVSKEMETSVDGVTRQVNKELDRHKKKIFKLASQKERSEEVVKEMRTKINEISKMMPFLTSKILFLGLDRNNSEYFFYRKEPNRIYVKYHNYLMDESEDYFQYESKESIIEFLRTLNNKGIREKHLIENITSLIKDQVLKNPIQDDHQEDHQYIPGLIFEPNFILSVTQEDVIQLIQQTQENFSTYLALKNYQWANTTTREVFIQNLKAITSLQELKQNFKSMQESFLFVEYINVEVISFKKSIEDSDEENKNLEREVINHRKKVPIRIWGINSEKIKKYWVEYLEECINMVGIWVCAYLFKMNVDRYVKKKMDSFYELQQKEERMRKQKEKEREKKHRLRKEKESESRERSRSRSRQREREREREKQKERERERQKEREIDRERQRDKERSRDEGKANKRQSSSSEEPINQKKPNLRTHKKKKMNIESEPSEYIEIQSEHSSGSSNEDCCEICGEYGDMICCDTCPKVYHVECLKIKDVPEGEWSCLKCYEKISNQRQTRSRVKKLDKQNN